MRLPPACSQPGRPTPRTRSCRSMRKDQVQDRVQDTNQRINQEYREGNITASRGARAEAGEPRDCPRCARAGDGTTGARRPVAQRPVARRAAQHQSAAEHAEPRHQPPVAAVDDPAVDGAGPYWPSFCGTVRRKSPRRMVMPWRSKNSRIRIASLRPLSSLSRNCAAVKSSPSPCGDGDHLGHHGPQEKLVRRHLDDTAELGQLPQQLAHVRVPGIA